MKNTPNVDRVRSIYQMLFEIATGNFSLRINQSGRDDKLDDLGKLLNTVAGAMRETVLETGFVNPHYSYQSLVQVTFVLDNKFSINGLSANASKMLGYNPEMLFSIPFVEILSSQSDAVWNQIMLEASTDKDYHHTVQLHFRSATKQLVPSFCTVSRLIHLDKIFISSISTVLQQNLYDAATPPGNNMPRPTDAQLIQKVYDYILTHLEDPLPSAKELSKLFGTNEFKIKDGFRHFFNTSVYQFYNEERLKKAHLLIQQSDVPLKTIAFSCGYNDYANFYKAFRKRFGYPPSDLMRDVKT